VKLPATPPQSPETAGATSQRHAGKGRRDGEDVRITGGG